MNKRYKFNDIEYDNLNELGDAFSSFFSEALDNIFSNIKKLIKFVRSKNKKLAKEIASIFTTCKYQNNVLTFIIFEFCIDKRVVINGVKYSFKEFTLELKNHKDKHKAIYAFMEDLGISKTYATLNIEPTLATDSYFIEKNISDSFVFEYLTTYFEFDYVESLQSFISNVFIYDDERFRRALKIVKNDRFDLILAHKIGFKDVYKMRNEHTPLFTAIKLLKSEFNQDDLKKLVSDTFFFWLLDNFDKYNYKKKAKPILKNLKKLKKINLKLNKKYDFMQYIDLAEELYETYLQFVDHLKEENITVKKKFDEAEFMLDKLYCKTFICTNYMKNHTVKLPKENINEEKIEKDDVETETEKDKEVDILEVEDLEEDHTYEPQSNEMSLKTLNKRVKQMNKMKRFILFNIIFIVLFVIVVGVIKILEVGFKDNFAIPENIIDMPYLIVWICCIVLNIILAIILRIRVGKTANAVDSVIRLMNIKDKELTASLERSLKVLKENEAILKEKAVRNHRILSAILLGLLGFISSVGIVFIISLVNSKFNLSIGWNEAYLNKDIKIVFLLGGAVLGLAYGLLRKRKGALTDVAIVILAFAYIVVLSLLM